MITGFEKRLRKEIAILDPDTSFNLIAPKERCISAWIGGSIIGCLSTFKEKAITK